MIIIAEVSELSRKIKLPTDRVLSVNGDYQVDGIAFKLPETYEGDFDFSAAAARVHWTGVGKVEHTNLLTDKDTSGRPLWIMPSELTQGGHGVIEFAISFVATDETAAVTKRWISDPVSFRNRRTVNGSNEDEEAEEETTYDRLASAIADVRAAQASVDNVAEVLSSLGTLTFHFVDAKADMTDQTKLYVLTTDGYLYYYSTAASDFVPAFEVGGSQEVIDARTDENGTTYANLKTRINTGFTQLKEDLSAVEEDSLTEIPFKQNVLKGIYIRVADGKSASSTKYARTSLIDIGDSKTISIQNTNYQMCVAYYDNTGTVSTGAGYIGSSNYVDGGSNVVLPSNAARFGVSFRRADQSELTDSDIEAISDAIEIKTIKANAALNAVDGLASEYTVVNKDSGVVINYYIGVANGEIISSGVTVKTLCLPCRPCETYRIRHPKSVRFCVASYVTQPRLGLVAQKVYDGRHETVTIFTTDDFASWLGIYYYSGTQNNPLTPEETYDVLKIEVVDSIALSAMPSCYTINNAIALPRTYEEVFALYDGLVASRPDYVTKNTLTSGNLTNYEYIFSTGNYNKYTEAKRNPDPEITKPTILLSSGVHGYERSAVVSLYLLMRDLCNNNYALTDLLNYVNIRVIPVGCPWGYTNNSRLNANGVNINRNFATSTWGDYEPGEPGSADYAGPSAGSEDETKIIQNWMQAHSDALFYIDFHNSNFSQEVVEISGPDTEECTLFKKRFLLAMNRVIPYWQKDRGMDSDDNMYCYTGGYDTIQGRTSRYYAYEVGIHKPFTCETSWNINGTGKHSIETFLVGAEAMGNFLVGMKKYYEEI